MVDVPLQCQKRNTEEERQKKGGKRCEGQCGREIVWYHIKTSEEESKKKQEEETTTSYYLLQQFHVSGTTC